MSYRDIHEYIPGQYQDVANLALDPAGADVAYFLDANQVRMACYNIVLRTESGGGTILVEGSDYTLVLEDQEISVIEGAPVYGGYQITNAVYQGLTLYFAARVVGGYTFRPYRPQRTYVTGDVTLTMSVISDQVYIAQTGGYAQTLTLPTLAGRHADNTQITIVPEGGGQVTVKHSSMASDIVLTGHSGSFVWADGWVPYGSLRGFTIVPGDPALIKDWVEKFYNPTTPPATLINSWGTGLYYLSIAYLFNGSPGRATMTLYLNVADGLSRYALASMDFTGGDSWIGGMYDAADNSFKPVAQGTDYTGMGVAALYRWENMATGQLTPPVDGWSTVYDVPSNTLAVGNSWGIGTYRVIVSTDSAGTTNTETYELSVPTITTDHSSPSVFISATSGRNITYESAGNRFVVSAVGTPVAGYIKRIDKFSGMLNVLHTSTTVDVGLPAGGATGNSLRKTSTADYAAGWVEDRLTGNRTVNFDPSMTSADIQSLIDAQPKNLNGRILTFQFADGTYAIISHLTFSDFFGGTLVIQGNTADTTLSPNKSVTINLQGDFTINLSRNTRVLFSYCKVTNLTATSGGYCVISNYNVEARVQGNSFAGNGVGRGLSFTDSGGVAITNYYDNLTRALGCLGGTVLSYGGAFYNCTNIYCNGGFITVSDTPLPTSYDQANNGVISIAAGIFNVDFPFANPPA